MIFVDFLIQFVIAMLSTISFAVLFTAPKKEIFYCGLTGAFGWIVYYLLTNNGIHLVLASGIATCCLTILSRCFAVVRKTPVTVYLLSGIFPLVPGAGIYYTAYYLFVGNTEMSGFKGLETLEIAGAIVFGIIFGFGIPQALFHKLSPKKITLNEES
ncbi:MAG: threonine/serine exporter family protein [Agathobacter sp.]